MEKLKSRKLWVAVFTGVLATLDGLGVVNMSDESVRNLVTIAASYILGQAGVDALQWFKRN